ncbi:unnamed protein product [Discosporangium mesarthrocarpum]
MKTGLGLVACSAVTMALLPSGRLWAHLGGCALSRVIREPALAGRIGTVQTRVAPSTRMVMQGRSLVIVPPSDDEERKEHCRRLADVLGSALVEQPDTYDAEYVLLFDDRKRLGLAQPGKGLSPLVVDFFEGRMGHRTRHQQGREQIVKAVSLPRARHTSGSEGHSGKGQGEDESPLLWDLTAGLGSDSFVLALAGWRVRMFERSPIVAALVQDALERARCCEDEKIRLAARRLDLTVADSLKLGTDITRITSSVDTWIEGGATAPGQGQGPRPGPGPGPRLGQGAGAQTEKEEPKADASVAPDWRRNQPAVVYLDPMFPQRKKKALVKKGMQMLQGLLEESSGTSSGGDQGHQDQQLFDVAVRLASRKVVVKRPVKGAALISHVEPSHSVVSKNNRFDVYPVIS